MVATEASEAEEPPVEEVRARLLGVIGGVLRLLECLLGADVGRRARGIGVVPLELILLIQSYRGIKETGYGPLVVVS